MLPTVDFCGLNLTRLLIGANPFGGFSHQNRERDAQMRDFHSPEQIILSWQRAQAAGINAFVTNNETKHVIDTTEQYLKNGGTLTWIAQVSYRSLGSMEYAIDRCCEIGCKAIYFHGGLIDECYNKRDEDSVRSWVKYSQAKGIPTGVAAHNPEAHRWINAMNITDFHVVPFFNCGSVHSRFGGERFQLDDVWEAVKVIQEINKPCIAYKILGAGRIDAAMGFDFALRHIKPTDVINVGMNRGDDDNMIEKDVALAEKLLL